MSDRERDMKGVDPIAHFKGILDRAEKQGIELFNAAALATVGTGGAPSLRMVLLKDVDARGFVFYTNLESRKAEELRRNPEAALCFWWRELSEQVRVEGTVEPVGDDEADRYFATRERGSQIGAWASRQSRSMPSREELQRAAEDVTRRFAGGPVPRPPFWSGYRLRTRFIEFWYGRPDRLHERYLYTRTSSGWEMSILYP